MPTQNKSGNDCAQGNNIGPVAFVTIAGVIMSAVLALVYFIMKIITHLAQQVPSWISAMAGVDLGADSAGQSAIQQGEQKGAKAMAGGVLAYGGKAAANHAARKEKERADAARAALANGSYNGDGTSTDDNAPVKEATAKGAVEDRADNQPEGGR